MTGGARRSVALSQRTERVVHLPLGRRAAPIDALWRTALALAATPALVATPAGCHPAPPAPYPSLVAQFHDPSGGARWEAIGAIETTSTVTVGGMTGSVSSLEDVRTGRFRTASTVGGMATAEGFDGTVAWQQTVGGEIALRDAPAAVQLARTQRWLIARGYFRAGGARYRVLGDRMVGTRAARAVERAGTRRDVTLVLVEQLP
jgi:hypothetical protein